MFITGCSKVEMQLSIVAKCTRRHSLVCTRASIGSKCNSVNAGVTGSRDRRFQTSRAAALAPWMHACDTRFSKAET